MEDQNLTVEKISQRLREAYGKAEITPYKISKLNGRLGKQGVKYYNAINSKLKPGVDTLQEIKKAIPALNLDYVLTGEGNLFNDNTDLKNNLNTIPFVPIESQKSFVQNFENENFTETDFLIIQSYLLNPTATNRAFQIDGAHMEEQIKNKSIIVGEFIKREEWNYISGGVFAILLSNRLVFYRIKNNYLSKGELDLYSDNTKFGSITIDSSEIREIWKITRIISAVVE